MRHRIAGVVVASLIAVGCLHAGEPEAQYTRGIVLSAEDGGGFLCVQGDTTGVEYCGECRTAEVVKECEKVEAGDYAEGKIADARVDRATSVAGGVRRYSAIRSGEIGGGQK